MILRLLIIFAITASCYAAPVKLAIVGTSPEVASPTALLTAALSKNSSIALLERESLDQILRERSLVATQLTNFLAASRIAGADSVLFVDTSGPRTNLSLSLRLVSVREGAVLFALQSAVAPENIERWAEKTSTQVATTVVKFGADRSKLTPLTVLNLRSPASTTASELLDRELTSLLLVRLARETNLLLLERRKLLDLSLEKDFAADTAQFWSGAWLLDGTVNKDGFHQDKTTLSLRLVAPDKKSTEFQVSGLRTNVGAVIEAATARLIDELNISESGSWDPAREAREHAEEAAWAVRWKMYPEAQAAADSAYALGLQTRDLTVTRALAYGRDQSASAPSFSVGGTFNLYRPVHPPPPERADSLFRGVAILDDLLRRDPPSLNDTNVLSAVVELLDYSGTLLMAYYSMVEAREGREERLAEWRRVCRNLQSAALQNATVREQFDDPLKSGASQHVVGARFGRPNIFKTSATYTGIFNETPEDALPVYRDLFARRGIPFIRDLFARYGAYPPVPRPVAGWKWADRKRDIAVWQNFIQELCSSTNLFTQLEGRVLDLRDEMQWQSYKARYTNFLAFLDKHWAGIEPRKNELWLAYAVDVRMPNRDHADEVQERESKEIAHLAYQFLADHGVQVGTVNGRKYIAKNLAAEAPSTKTPPAFTPPLLGPALKPTFVELAPLANRPTGRILHSQIYRDGKMWFLFTGLAGIQEFDLKTGARRTSPAPANLSQFPPFAMMIPDSARLAKSLEVRSNELFLINKTTLFRQRDGEAWTSQTLPIDNPDIHQVHGRLFLSGTDSIYELDESGSMRLLASARRKPAASLLDQLDSFNFAQLSAGPNEAVRAFIAGNGYQWNGRIWIALTAFTDKQSRVSDHGAVFTSSNAPPFVQLHSLSHNDSIPQYLAVGAFPNTDPATFRGETNRWVVSANALYGGYFFIDSIPAVFCKAERENEKSSEKWRLLLFPPDAKGPVNLPVDFDERSAKGLINAFQFGFRRPWALNTPDGLVLGHALLSGFWIIPKTELDAAVTQAMRVANAGFQTSSAK